MWAPENKIDFCDIVLNIGLDVRKFNINFVYIRR